MDIFKKSFKGVLVGTIYPVQYEAGQRCPPELLDQAIAADVIGKTADDSQHKPSDEFGLGGDHSKDDSESFGDVQKPNKKAKNGKTADDNQDAPPT